MTLSSHEDLSYRGVHGNDVHYLLYLEHTGWGPSQRHRSWLMISEFYAAPNHQFGWGYTATGPL